MKKIVFLSFVVAIFLWSSEFSGDTSQTLQNQDVKGKINSGFSGKTIQPTIDFLKLPLSFIANQGQVDKKARFYAKTSGYTLWLTAQGLVFDSVQQEGVDQKEKNPKDKMFGPRAKILKKKNRPKVKRDVSRLLFIGANKNPEIVAVDKTSHKVNYFIGKNRSKWFGDVPTCGAVLYKNIYKNIDLKVYGIEKQIEYDWIVRPGGNPSDIRFEYQNVKSTEIDKNGDLVIETDFGTLTHQKPVSFLKEDILKLELGVKFKKLSKGVYGFSVPLYDTKKTLVIDPVVLVYSTYLGGTSVDYGYAIAVDSSGCAYVTGHTYSTNFPILNQFQSDQGSADVFVTKIDTYQSGASSLIYSTYLGGSSFDYGFGIAVDNSGCAYVTGNTWSSDFTTLNQYQTYQGSYDVFVTKIDTYRSGVSSLLYSTYLGGSSDDYGSSIAVDSSGNAYVTGSTRSSDFPTLNQYQTNKGDSDAFVTKIDTTRSGASSLIYSTYLGGSNTDQGYGIAVDSSGCAYVTGDTYSSNFPILNQYQATNQGSYDVFMSKIDTTQSGVSSLIYSTYLGGSSWEFGYGIALDSSGCVYVAGYTWSSDFLTLNQYQTYQGSYDVFVTKIDATQSGVSSLIYSTYLGGSLHDSGLGIAVDTSGCAYVTGYTVSPDFPTLNQYQTDQGQGYWDVFVTKISFNTDLAILQVVALVSGGNGTVSPQNQTVGYGDNASINITPDEGYEIASITDNGVAQLIANPYVIPNVTSNHYVRVTFKPSIILGISAVRKTERAWIIKRDYGKIVLTVANAPSVVSGYELLRSTGNGPFEVISNIEKTHLSAGQYIYNDIFIDRNKTYVYKFAVYYGSGKRVLESISVQI